MQQSTFKRNAKIWGIGATKELTFIFKEQSKVLNDISYYFWLELKNNNIVKINRHNVELKNKKLKKDTELKNELSHLFPEQARIENFRRSLVKHVMERYRSYIKRNKEFPKSPIRFHDKSMYFKDNSVRIDIKNKIITFQTLRGPKQFSFSNSIKLELLNKNKFGGNLTISKNKKSYYFVAAVEKIFEPKYKHKSFLAYDLNMDVKNWIVFSDQTIIKRPKNINNIIKEIKELNKLSNEKNLNISQRTQRSKERKKTRLKVQYLHKELKKTISTITNKIIRKAISKKAVLCIDSVQCGKKTGTFGQDHLKSTLVTECQNKGIPYYIIPTPFTTQKCSKCGYISEENKINSIDFKCCNCRYETMTHKNAAINIKQKGIELYKEKKSFGDYSNSKDFKEKKEKKEILETFFS